MEAGCHKGVRRLPAATGCLRLTRVVARNTTKSAEKMTAMEKELKGEKAKVLQLLEQVEDLSTQYENLQDRAHKDIFQLRKVGECVERLVPASDT